VVIPNLWITRPSNTSETFQANRRSDPSARAFVLGAGVSNEKVAAIVKQRSLPVRYVENIEEESARLLAQNKILAWFQGRMESGPHALGNRFNPDEHGKEGEQRHHQRTSKIPRSISTVLSFVNNRGWPRSISCGIGSSRS
jgi:hypothetical protein